LVNLPVGVVLLWLTLTRLPESRDPTPSRLDLAGLLTFGGACFLATCALIRGNTDGWTRPGIAGALAAAASPGGLPAHRAPLDLADALLRTACPAAKEIAG
jgi:hypothetical protein